MAINFFEDTSTKVFVEKPFIEEFSKNNTEFEEYYEIISIRKTRKGNGYLLESDAFIIFLYNKSKVLQQLLEALNVYVSSGHGFKILCVVLQNDPYYQLGVDPDKPTNWSLTQGKYHVGVIHTFGLEVSQLDQNPFLPIPNTGNHKKSKPRSPSQ